jgi:hypothetical protein
MGEILCSTTIDLPSIQAPIGLLKGLFPRVTKATLRNVGIDEYRSAPSWFSFQSLLDGIGNLGCYFVSIASLDELFLSFE